MGIVNEYLTEVIMEETIGMFRDHDKRFQGLMNDTQNIWKARVDKNIGEILKTTLVYTEKVDKSIENALNLILPELDKSQVNDVKEDIVQIQEQMNSRSIWKSETEHGINSILTATLFFIQRTKIFNESIVKKVNTIFMEAQKSKYKVENSLVKWEQGNQWLHDKDVENKAAERYTDDASEIISKENGKGNDFMTVDTILGENALEGTDGVIKNERLPKSQRKSEKDAPRKE